MVFNTALATLYGVPPAIDFSEDVALLKKSLAIMNSWLSDRKFIAGPEVSVADIRCALGACACVCRCYLS